MDQKNISISVEMAVRLSALSRSFLYAAMKRRELPFLKVGRRRLIMVRDLERWLHAQRKNAA